MQQHETALSAALKRSGFDTGVRLHAVASRILADEGGDMARSARQLWAKLDADTELKTQAMLCILDAVSEDMHGMPGAGHISVADEGPAMNAPARQQNGDGAGLDHHSDEGQPSLARPSPQSREAGAIRCVPAGRILPAPAREPSAAAVAAKGRAVLMSAQSVLDTFRITERQGSMTAIGDVKISSYGRLMRTLGKRSWVSSREYNLICLLKAEADKIAYIPEGFTARDIFDTKLVEEKIRMASQLAQPIEASDAA